MAGVDAVVLTHGGDMDGEGESSFYAAIPALLDALGDNNAHISLMTAMNASHSAGPSSYGFVEWKRRAERLVRASGHPYTIVRPGWFDYQGPGDRRIDLRQGDLITGRPGVDRHHIAQVLLEGITNPSGARGTVEVFSASGAPVADFEALFAATRADEPGALDGVTVLNCHPLLIGRGVWIGVGASIMPGVSVGQEQDGKDVVVDHSIRYSDTPVLVDGAWLISRCEQHFVITETRPL